MIKNFITALQFLTIITVSKKHAVEENDLAKSMVYFPFVGFLLGTVLVYADMALAYMLPHTIANALLLLLLLVLTRAIHIDGLADTLDGIMGGADRSSRLAIMKDSRLGTAGALGILFILLIKYLSLNALFGDDKTGALLLSPVLGRWSQTVMVFRANYGREHGMGRAFVGHLRAGGLAAAAVLAIGLMIFVSGPVRAAVLFSSALALTAVSRWYLVRKLGGITGDAIGAVSEVNEAAAMLLFVTLAGVG